MREFTNKLLISVFIVMYAASMISCSKSANPTSSAISVEEKEKYDFGGQEISIATYWGTDLSPGQNEQTDRFIARISEVEKECNFKFNYKKAPTEYWSNMITTILAGQPYGDIMFAFPWTFNSWILAGAIKDVGTLDAVDFEDGSWNNLVKGEATYAGRIFGFSKEPMTVNSGLVFNKRLFAEANLESPYDLIKEDKWNFATMEDYAKKMTKDTDGDGITDQWGLSTMDSVWLATSMILANDGKLIDNSTSPAKFVMDSANSLEALNLYNKMVNVDKTLYARPSDSEWNAAVTKMVDGKIGMFRTEQWVLVGELSGKMKDEYGLVYFPKGPKGKDYVDETFGGNIMFIPSSLSDEKAKTALIVYDALYATLYPELTFDEYLQNTAEGFLQDQDSVNIYKDIIQRKLALSNGIAKAGIYDAIWDLVYKINANTGTPKSIVETAKPELQGVIDLNSFE